MPLVSQSRNLENALGRAGLHTNNKSLNPKSINTIPFLLLKSISVDKLAIMRTARIEADESSEDGSRAPGPPVLTEDELKRNRTFMTIVHFILTYSRWSLSLFLLLASRSLPLPLAREAVREPLQDLQAVAEQESQLYYECTVNAFDVLADKLNATVAVEYPRVAEKHTSNRLLLDHVEQLSGRCFNASRSARRALQTWRQQSPLVLIHNSSVCSSQDRANISRILGEDYTLVQDQVGGLLDDYVDASRSSARRIADYAQARATYDYNYFVGLKLQASLDLLDGYTIPDIDLSVPESELIEKLRALLQAILDALADAKIRIELLSARIADFYASIQSFYVSYLDVYNRLSLAADFVRDFLPGGIPVPAYLDLDGVPVADFLLPSVFEIPTFSVDLPAIEDLVSDFIRQALELLVDLVAELAEEASDQLREALEELIKLLRELLTVDDYDPPQFVGSRPEIGSLSAELDLINDLGEAAKSQLRDALRQVQGSGVPNFDRDPSLPDVQVDTPSFEGNSTTFEYLEPQFPRITIPDFIEAFFSFIIANQWIVELVVQFLRLLRLKRKYEKDATPDLPEIDYATGDEEEDKQKTSSLTLVQEALLKHFLTPWMALGLILFPFALIIITIWFPHVKASCINSRDGTVVARNLITPLLINKANLAGNNYHAGAEFQCLRAQRRICDQMYTESDRIQREDDFSLFSAQLRFNESIGVNQVFTKCIDTDLLDEEFASSCCGLEGYISGCSGSGDAATCPVDSNQVPPSSFRPLGEYLSNEACQADLTTWELEDARFDCSSLQDICDAVPCTGVDTNRIKYMAIEADCQVETYAIKCCLLVLLALYHAIMVNLCSTLAFHGIKHLRWRSLRPDGIKLRTNVNADGELVKGDDKDERSKRIAVVMRRFELIGWLQLILGGIFFLVWFISFFVFRHLLSDFT